MEKIVYFGAGQSYIELKEMIMAFEKKLEVCVLGIMDNNSKIWGNTIDGKKVISPQKIEDCDYYVITTFQYYEEIKKQLVELYKIDSKKIVWCVDYFRNRFAKAQYNKKYREKPETKKSIDIDKITVYTCIIGDYDNLKEPLYVSENIEYICFTNNLKIYSDIWKIIHIENEYNLDNVHLARYIKLFPDKFLKRDGISVWVDAKYAIKDDLREYIKLYGGTKKILCFPHPERDCIYQEGEACINLQKVNKKDVNKQLKHYKELGYPLHQGLYETGCIVRMHGDMEVQELMHRWWREIETFTHRDQISFPYVCKDGNIFPDVCDININNNRWLQVYEHNI